VNATSRLTHQLTPLLAGIALSLATTTAWAPPEVRIEPEPAARAERADLSHSSIGRADDPAGKKKSLYRATDELAAAEERLRASELSGGRLRASTLSGERLRGPELSGTRATRFINTAKRLLDSPHASGWAIECGGQVVRAGGRQAVSDVDATPKFTIQQEIPPSVQAGVQPFLEQMSERHYRGNTTWMSARDSALASDLTAFYQVHNRLLRDLNIELAQKEISPLLNWVLHQSPGAFQSLQDSHSIVITTALLPDNQEAITVFELRDLALLGFLRGRTFIVTRDNAGEVGASLAQQVSGGAHGRAYLFGERSRLIDVNALLTSAAAEPIYRSDRPADDLLTKDLRLEQLDNMVGGRRHVTVANGLPRTEVDVSRMGLYAGEPDAWLAETAHVDESSRQHGAREVVTTAEGLIHELTEGESDIVILVAHSNGADLYYNGTPISFDELNALPNRTSQMRPRLAVLIACGAGKAQTSGLRGLWRSITRDRVLSLAEILVEKRFVDKVIAPDHDVSPQEGRAVLTDALRGPSMVVARGGWIRWTVVWKLLDQPNT
jgi:hypothetical protein